MISSTPNSYSQRWFEAFQAGIPEERTEREVAFVCACAPLSDYQKVLDVCCGAGRHARALAARGYTVTGVERDAAAVAKARELEGGPSYIQANVRDYRPEAAAYNLAIVMSQSFGYFAAAANLDLWNPDFFATHQGQRDLQTPTGSVQETTRVEGDRLFVRLDYPGGGQDDFEWQLFAATEMRSMAESVGLRLMIACADFDAATKPSPENPRIQFVLQKWKS
jgi:SAM-dependent methyltransferase